MRRSPNSRKSAPQKMTSLALAVLAACGSSPPAPRASTCPSGAVTLAGHDDVTALAGCTAVASLSIRTGEALDLAPLASLSKIAGDLAVGPSVGFTELALRGLAEVGGTIKIAGNANLHGVFLPLLSRASGFDIGGNVAMTTLSLPRLEATGAFAVIDNAELELVDASRLATVTELAIADNPKLVLVELPALVRAGSVRVEGNRILPDEQAEALRKLAP